MTDPGAMAGLCKTGVSWAAESYPRPGSARSGDAWCVLEEPDRTLLAVIDGLGHGDEAHAAASTIAAELRTRWPAPVTDLLSSCHRAARRTRGGVVSVAEIDVSTACSPVLTWVGVGNVEGSVWRPAGSGIGRLDWLFLPGGVVGYRLPNLRERRIALEPGDVLVFSTDGAPGAHDDPPPRSDPLEAVRALLERHATGRDDAVILLARYLSAGATP